jgi:hypothetical protein
MSERKDRLRAHMESRHAETWPVLQSLSAADMSVTVYSDDDQTWTVKDLIGHLADGERGNLGQVQRLVAGGQTVPEDFDLDRWNRSAVRKSGRLQPEELLASVAEHYQLALEFLEGLDDDQLDLIGRHSSGEMLSAEGFLRRMVDHRAEHVADISQALER